MSELAPKVSPLSIERLTICADRVVCDVILAPGVPRMTTPEIITQVGKTVPSLSRHTCVNDEGDTFAAVMDHTSLPHLLEHLVIHEQARAAAHATSASGLSHESVFVGTTEWTDEFSGKARIEVSFTDDLVALRAFRDATRFLNNVVVS